MRYNPASLAASFAPVQPKSSSPCRAVRLSLEEQRLACRAEIVGAVNERAVQRDCSERASSARRDFERGVVFSAVRARLGFVRYSGAQLD